MLSTRKFAVAFSFPGEHRKFAHEIAECVADALGRERVFYDEWYEARLVGANGDLKLREVYGSHSEFVVPFFSNAYKKPWCSLEWSAIREVLLTRRSEDCVIPVEIESVKIDGWGDNDFAIHVKNRSGRDIAELIVKIYRERAGGELPLAGPVSSPTLPKAPAKKPDLESILGLMQSTDAVAAAGAVEALDNFGSSGEDAFLDHQELDLDSVITLARGLRYVSLRGASLAEKLVGRLESVSGATAYRYAELAAGVRPGTASRDRIFHAIEQHFDGVPGHGFTVRETWRNAYDANQLGSLLLAYGRMGGWTNWLFDWPAASESTWEKLSTISFRGACASFARTGEGGESIRRFLLSEQGNVPPQNAYDIMRWLEDRRPVDADEVRLEAYRGSFCRWRRQDVLDEVLYRWAVSKDPVVRRAAAYIVDSFGAQRTLRDVERWRDREDDPRIEATLHNLAFDLSLRGRSGERFDAISKQAASADVSALGADAAIWLARAGVKLRHCEAMLSESDWYQRACASVALAYGGNGAGGAYARETLYEACKPIERLILGIALALDGGETSGEELHRILVSAGQRAIGMDERVNFPYLNKVVTVALTDALERALPASKEHWLKEIRPFPV